MRQELAIWRRALESPLRSRRPLLTFLPSPLTAPVRLGPGLDPALRLDPAALRRRFVDQEIRFDPEQPAVAVSVDFLGSSTDMLPLGLIPVSQSGDIVVGWINLERTMALSEHEAVLRIDALRVLSPTGGGGGSFVGGGPTDGGANVRLACIDMGFDFLHPGVLQSFGWAGASPIDLAA